LNILAISFSNEHAGSESEKFPTAQAKRNFRYIVQHLLPFPRVENAELPPWFKWNRCYSYPKVNASAFFWTIPVTEEQQIMLSQS